MDPSSWPKSAPIIGPEDSQETLAFSDQVVLTLLVLQPGQKLPQTFEPEADMVVHVLESSPGAKIGQTDFFLEDAHQGDVSFFLHTMSKVFEVGLGRVVRYGSNTFSPYSLGLDLWSSYWLELATSRAPSSSLTSPQETNTSTP